VSKMLIKVSNTLCLRFKEGDQGDFLKGLGANFVPRRQQSYVGPTLGRTLAKARKSV
jgi:hypothetical protein